MNHHPDCDVNDTNPDGIVKPCNCGLANLQAELGHHKRARVMKDLLNEAQDKRIQELEAENKVLRERAEKAEAACAEMRGVLEDVNRLSFGINIVSERLQLVKRNATHALSSDVGKGWCSPEEKARLEAMVAEMRDRIANAHDRLLRGESDAEILKLLRDSWGPATGKGWLSPERSAALQREAQVLTEQKAREIAERLGYLPPDRRKAMEEILDLAVFHGGIDYRTGKCYAACPRCRWEKLKSVTSP